MKHRTASLLGVLTGLALILTACCTLPACSAVPPYMSIGVHWTTIPGTTPPTPTPPPSTSATTAVTPRA